MTDPREDYAELGDSLRQILRAEADPVVPSGDGLERIRAKIELRPAQRFGGWLRPAASVAGALALAAGVVLSVPTLRDPIGGMLAGSGGSADRPEISETNRQPPLPVGPSVSPQPSPSPDSSPTRSPDSPKSCSKASPGKKKTSSPSPDDDCKPGESPTADPSDPTPSDPTTPTPTPCTGGDCPSSPSITAEPTSSSLSTTLSGP